MCGIVGVLGSHQAAPILVDGLKRLEYRGYDSAGIATVNDGVLDRRRAVGKLVNLSDLLVIDPLRGRAGIGHTRWATHGAPNVANAHPHQAGRVAVVHNGIIENFRELRAELTDRGIGFETETDTETIALLTDAFLNDGLSPVQAVDATIAKLDGAYALAFLFEGEDDLMITCRKGSPLAIGHGDGEVYVGSDALALAPFTDRVTYLAEGDRAILTRQSIEIADAQGRLANRAVTAIAAAAGAVDKRGHKHFMAKEIAEQPSVLSDTIAAYFGEDDCLSSLADDIDFSAVSRISLVACGTAYLAGMTAKYWFERWAGIPVDVDIASEFRYREPPVPDGTLAIFLSQSGETADTIAALRYMSGRAEKVVVVVNVVESTMSREADVVLPLFVGPEIGVASTKAFTAMLVVLQALCLRAANARGLMDGERLGTRVADMRALPVYMSAALTIGDRVNSIANDSAQARDVLFLGRGQMYPLALEGALKLKEISYIHAEGYASGELKHGPIALVDKTVPVIVMAPSDSLFEKSVSNMQEVMAREGPIILISDAEGLARAGDGVRSTISMPAVPDALAPIVYAIPAQLIAYHTAVAKGTDADQPRNLAKSVTVE